MRAEHLRLSELRLVEMANAYGTAWTSGLLSTARTRFTFTMPLALVDPKGERQSD
jgi:hypothetical protein